MGLSNKIILKTFFICAAVVIHSVAYASWQSGQEIVSGTWGIENTGFGLERGDTIASDVYPEIEAIMGDYGIVVSDRVNMRTVVYSSVGALKYADAWRKVKKPNGMVSYEHSKYLLGCCVAGYESGNLWMGSENYYALFSNSGEIVQSTTARPLKLGMLKAKQLSASQWRYEIEYPDAIFFYEGAKDSLNQDGLLKISSALIMQNRRSKVIAYNVAEELPQQPNEKKKYRLAVASEWTKPEDEYGPVRVVGVERLPTLVAQYGEAVLGPDGSIYAWMRTDTQYRILRWNWVQ